MLLVCYEHNDRHLTDFFSNAFLEINIRLLIPKTVAKGPNDQINNVLGYGFS